MEKNLSIVSILLVTLVIGFYVSREITKSEYKIRLKEIETIKDSLDAKVKLIDIKLSQSDHAIINQIETSEQIIKDISNRIGLQQSKKQNYISKTDSILKVLRELEKID